MEIFLAHALGQKAFPEISLPGNRADLLRAMQEEGVSCEATLLSSLLGIQSDLI